MVTARSQLLIYMNPKAVVPYITLYEAFTFDPEVRTCLSASVCARIAGMKRPCFVWKINPYSPWHTRKSLPL
jgi:hypothetical protein